jgi:CheY-like chemotaxis protein
MDKITGITDWKPINKGKQKPESTLDILLGVNSRLQEILLTSILSHTPHRVHVVDSGTMAISSLKQHHFDLIIFNYEMPDSNASQTTKAIRFSNEPWHSIPIIGLLDNQANLIMANCIAAGMNTFVCQPMCAKKLLGLVKYYQQKESTVS